jgi:phosphoribulokinase
MSRVNTLVVPGGKMNLAMELILTPLVEQLIIKRRQARGQINWLE